VTLFLPLLLLLLLLLLLSNWQRAASLMLGHMHPNIQNM